MATALALVASTLTTASVAAAPQGHPHEPAVTVLGTKDDVVAKRSGRVIYPRFGVHAVAGDIPFEIWTKRDSYSDPIEATRVIRHRGSVRHEKLPEGLVRTWRGGLRDFTRLVVKDSDGRKVVDRKYAFCPRGGKRTGPDAPERSPYPRWCEGMRWTLGMVWGLQANWRTPLLRPWSTPLRLPVGNYTAKIGVTKTYRDVFDIPTDQASATVTLKVRKRDRTTMAATTAEAGPGSDYREPQPAAQEPKRVGKVPNKRYRPDLRALPAWSIRTRAGRERDFIVFSANVWNAGPSPLVVDGFRRSGEDVMDGYQYFFNDDRERVGYVKTGTMRWDDRDGHTHWHFKDFARYRLLDANQQRAVRSHKESFCIVPTDAIDYTVRNADWRPGTADLHTSCGGRNAQSVREVMQVGSGDTYSQWTPGQAFNITRVPNGRYVVEVTANPLGRLYEANSDNNVSLRKVVLRGRPGNRTVQVLPYGG